MKHSLFLLYSSSEKKKKKENRVLKIAYVHSFAHFNHCYTKSHSCKTLLLISQFQVLLY